MKNLESPSHIVGCNLNETTNNLFYDCLISGWTFYLS